MTLFDNEEGTRLLSPSPDVRLNSRGYLNTNHSLSYLNCKYNERPNMFGENNHLMLT